MHGRDKKYANYASIMLDASKCLKLCWHNILTPIGYFLNLHDRFSLCTSLGKCLIMTEGAPRIRKFLRIQSNVEKVAAKVQSESVKRYAEEPDSPASLLFLQAVSEPHDRAWIEVSRNCTRSNMFVC